MVKLVMENGREVFLGAGRAYLMTGLWIEHHGFDPGSLKAAWNSWEDFINGFHTAYVVLWRARLEREAAVRRLSVRKARLSASLEKVKQEYPNLRQSEHRKRYECICSNGDYAHNEPDIERVEKELQALMLDLVREQASTGQMAVSSNGATPRCEQP